MAVKKSKSTKKNARQPRKREHKPFTNQEVRHVAVMRRQGKTWKDVYGYLGRRSNATVMRTKLEKLGFDRYGRKDGKGKSKSLPKTAQTA